MKKIAIFLSLAILFGSRNGVSQVNPNIEQGIHVFGSYDANKIDTINLQNGGLAVNIPLFSYPERGKFGAAVNLMASGKQFTVKVTCNKNTGTCRGSWEILSQNLPVAVRPYPNTVGMGVVVDDGLPHLNIAFKMAQGPNGGYQNTATYSMVKADGSSSELIGDTTVGANTVDGTAITFPVSTSHYLLDRAGVSSALWSGSTIVQAEDPNGNMEQSSAGQDSMGRNNVYSAIQNAQTITGTSGSTDGCKGPLPIVDVKLLTFPGPNDGPNHASRLLKLCSVAVVGQTNFNVQYQNSTDPNDPNNGYPIAEGTFAGNVVQTALLYDGNSWLTSPAWEFEYNNNIEGTKNSDGSYQENDLDLTKITFPTGGSIAYVWGTSTNQALCGVTSVSRIVTERIANANDGSPAQVTYYSNGRVTDSLGNYVSHGFSSPVPGGGGTCNTYESRTEWHDLSSGTDKTLKTVMTDYTSTYDQFDPSSTEVLVVNVLPIRTTTTLSNGMVSKIEKDYDQSLSVTYWDPSFSSPTGTVGAYNTLTSYSRGLVTQLREFGYGNGAPGPLVRCTQYSYVALQNSQYLNANILDIPATVSVYSGACGSGTLVSQTSYGYDEASLQPSNISVQRDSSAATRTVRGNLTSIHKWLNTGGTVNTSTSYYDTGMPYQSKDANGNAPTTYTYSPAYQGALLTQTQMPSTGNPAVQHIVGAQYDFNTGEVTSYTDQNSNTTSYAYDALGRMTQATFPVVPAGQPITTLSYPNLNTVVESVLQGKTTKTIFDGLGRKSHVTLTDPEGNDTTDYTYDALDRLASVSNPYRSTSDSTYGLTSYKYDALARPTLQTNPDGSTLTWSYTGNITDSFDETGRHWQRTTDAFGHLAQVREPDGSNNPTVETDYQYDALNDLTRVDQWGGASGSTGDRIRTFTYDSLSRLLSASNPESGTVTYGYDYNGNMTSKTDARGIAVSYTYDALNRMLTKTASGIGYKYFYDTISGTPPLYNTIGKLVDESNWVNADQVYSYDAMGRINWVSSWTPSSPNNTGIITSAVYNLAGDLQKLTYPDGRVASASYDGAEHLAGLQYSGWNGASVNYSYLVSATYAPTGSPQSMTYGNGAIAAYTYNNRLQPKDSAVQSSVNGQLATVYSKHYCYGLADAQSCPAIGPDNGNVYRVLDMFTNSHSQGFSYDNVNRLIAFNTGDNAMVQTFGYDAWGNMNQAGTQSFQVPYGANNHINGSGFVYDAAGDLTQTNFGIPQTYAYDALGQLTNYNNGAATYTYDAAGQRVRKDSGGSWTEYVYWNGQPLAEKNADGSWSDYIYANGARVARADSYDERLHTHGTCTVTCQVVWQVPAASYTIKSGDKLSWRQYQNVAIGGMVLNFTDGTYTTTWKDLAGQTVNALTTEGQWVNRSADMSGFAGKVVSGFYLGTNTGTPHGTWDIYYGDISVTHADGTVTTIYARQAGVVPTLAGNSGGTNLNAYTERSNTSGDSMIPETTTSYYVGDHLGSARMLLAAGGWPVSAENYYPYGVEQAAPADQNHYKFTDKERDAESGNDDFGARYYAGTMGRFLSPDWSETPQAMPYADLTNPQSFNRYAYVNGNPLSGRDLDGHCDQSLLPTLLDMIPYVAVEEHPVCKNPPAAVDGIEQSSNSGLANSLMSSGAVNSGNTQRFTWGNSTPAIPDPDGTYHMYTRNNELDIDLGFSRNGTSNPFTVAYTGTGILVPLVGVGPAVTFSYVPSQHLLCIGGGVGASIGHTGSFGPVVIDKAKSRQILGGGSFSFGGNLTPFTGVQGAINGSGGTGGYSVGVPGVSGAATYSVCF